MEQKKLIFVLLITIIIITTIPIVKANPNIMPINCKTMQATNNYEENESLCVYGTGFQANQEINILVVEHKKQYQEGGELKDKTEKIETIRTTNKGILILTKIWEKVKQGIYDIIADINKNSKYDQGDVVNSIDEGITIKGEAQEVPEFPTIMSIIILIAAGIFIQKKRKEK